MREAEPPLTRGHKKKARTRRLLLDAALEVLAEQGEAFSTVEIAARAGVSHGTIYNYFADRDELVAALVGDVVGAFASRSAVEVDEPDPAARFALITARALASAISLPEVARVVVRFEAAQRALVVQGPLAHLREDLMAGYRAGRFTDRPDAATVDVVLGALLLAARRIVDGETGVAYRRTVIRRLLQALGVDAHEAAELVKQAVPSTARRRAAV